MMFLEMIKQQGKCLVIHGDEISIFDYHQRYHPENSHLKIGKKYRVKISIEEVTQ